MEEDEIRAPAQSETSAGSNHYTPQRVDRPFQFELQALAKGGGSRIAALPPAKSTMPLAQQYRHQAWRHGRHCLSFRPRWRRLPFYVCIQQVGLCLQRRWPPAQEFVWKPPRPLRQDQSRRTTRHSGPFSYAATESPAAPLMPLSWTCRTAWNSPNWSTKCPASAFLGGNFPN